MAGRADDTCDAAMPQKDLADLEDESKTPDDLPSFSVDPDTAGRQVPSTATVNESTSAPPVIQAELPVVEDTDDVLSQRIHELDLEKESLTAELTRSHAREARLRASVAALTERLDSVTSATVRPESAESKQVDLLSDHIRRLQDMLDEVERGRQQAVFKISEMATRSASCDDSKATSFEWIHKTKHDFELLNQRTRLLLAQQDERHAAAMDVATRRLAIEHAAAIDRLRLEHEIQLTEWRHEESRRMKEVEAAMEADKSSVRLEMKHSIESTRIHQRVTVPSSDATSASSSASVVDADTIVRLQLDALRTRRMDALKKLCLIRISMARTRLHIAWRRWNVQGSALHTRKHVSCHRMAAVLTRWRQQALRRRFQGWYLNTRMHHWQSIHSTVLSRIVAVERLHHLVQLRTRTQVVRAFAWWRGGATGATVEANQLRQEITKLHDELAKTKAETWRCKRQMLQQFKQSAM